MEIAFAGVDRRLEQVARSLGAGPWRTFLTVTVPLASRGLLGGVLLGFIRGLGEFGATIVVAGNIPGRTQTLPLAIFTSLETGKDEALLRLVLFSIGLALVTLVVHALLVSRRPA
jgi:molybdate transport system permease protein